MVCKNDASGYTNLASKSEAPQNFKDLAARFNNKFHRNLENLRTDRGREWMGADFQQWLR